MIKVNGLTKQYGFNVVLRGVSLSVAQGEFVTIVGANGAGKSTLMRILATLQKPTSGTVTIGGWPLPEYAENVRRYIGLVSHHSLLYHDLTAVQNLQFFAQLYDIPNAAQRINDSLKLVGLASRQRDPVRTFSRGMLQRLTIARATLHEPDILLLDEPYTGLDQEATAVLDTLLQQQSEQGRTILMITHDILRGTQICDRVLMLNRGKIVQSVETEKTTPADILTLYQEATKPKKKKRA